MKYIDNPSLLNLRFNNGMLILPWFYTNIMYRLNGQRFSGDNKKPCGSLKRLLNLLKQIRHIKIRRSPVLIFSSCLFNVKDEKGAYFNSLHGFYYDLFPLESFLIEDGDMNNEWRPTGKYNHLSYINTFITFVAHVLAAISNKMKKNKRADYDEFLSYFPDIATYDELSKIDYFIGYYYKMLNWLIKRVQPQVVIVNCGTYGMEHGIICKAVHENHAIAIDTQHGQIYHHGAYSVSPVIKSSKEYMEYIPDYLYSFGEYWSKCVEWDYEKISVGNPYLNKYVDQYAYITDYEQDILIISQPIYKELQIPFIKRLATLLKDKKIVIRLHPVEKLEEQSIIYKECTNIKFSDSTKVLYQDMCSSRFVIGWNSTCLFELLAFGRIPIIIENEISCGHFPKEVGIWVKTPEDLCEKVRNDVLPKTNNGGYFWQQKFEENVKNHIHELLSLTK